MQLQIKNFQAIKDADLIFNPGVNIIVGANSSGKTALLRAFRAAILNNIPTSKINKFLTHGEKEIGIKLTLDEDFTYEYLKSEKNGTIYKVIDNIDQQVETYEKCGNNDLFDYIQEPPFVLRDKALINTHMTSQGMPFPFNLNDVELFKIFEELYNISSSATIFKKLKSLETQANSEVTRTKEEIKTNKDNIELIVEIEDKFDLEKLDNIKARAEKVQAGMIGLEEDIKTARQNNKISKAIKVALEFKKDSEETNNALDKISTLINDSKELHKDIRIVNSNNKIEQINIYKKDFNTDVIEPYKALSSDLKLVKSLENDLKDAEEEIKDLKEEYDNLKEELAKVEVCPLCGQKIEGEHKNG